MLLDLFLSFFKIGLFSFGGGYAMIPLIQTEVMEINSWMSPTEFLDMLAIAQVTPGPIAINTATFVGYRVEGFLGAATATTAVVLPSLIIVILLSYVLKKMKDSKQIEFLYNGLRPMVLALIFSALVSIGKESIVDLKGIIIAGACLLLLKFTRVKVLGIILISGIMGVFFY